MYPNYDLYHFLLNVLLLQNGIFGIDWSFNSPSWCLSVTLVMYVVFYIVCYHTKNKSTEYYIFAGLAIFGASTILSKLDFPILNILMGRGILGFSLGVLLFGLYSFQNEDNKKNFTILSYFCLIFLVFVYFVLRFGKETDIGDTYMFFFFGISSYGDDMFTVYSLVIQIPWESCICIFREDFIRNIFVAFSDSITYTNC